MYLISQPDGFHPYWQTQQQAILWYEETLQGHPSLLAQLHHRLWREEGWKVLPARLARARHWYSVRRRWLLYLTNRAVTNNRESRFFLVTAQPIRSPMGMRPKSAPSKNRESPTSFTFFSASICQSLWIYDLLSSFIIRFYTLLP